MKLAALDLGSNSFHLLVAKALPNQELRKIGSGKDSLRLGSVVQEHGALTHEAFEAAFASVRRLSRLAAELGAERLGVVATSALRDAKNGPSFLTACETRLGVQIELLSGDEEARLVYHGAASAFPKATGRILVADIGGGSLELAAGQAGHCEVMVSLPLGFLRLTSAMGSGDAALLTDHVRSECEKVRFQIGRFDTLLLSGGTARSIGKLLGSQTAVRLSPFLCAGLARMTPAELLGLGVDEKRADTLAAGAAVLGGLLAAFAGNDVRISPRGLREGVLLRDIERRAELDSNRRARADAARLGFAV